VRVVIDTNVVVSAALKDRVPEELILFVIGNNEFEWVASAEIVEEYLSVLKRKKFSLPRPIIQRWANAFKQYVALVTVEEKFNFPRDQKDAKFLECALSAQVDYLISGDKDFEGAYKLGKTIIISVSEFKQLIIDKW